MNYLRESFVYDHMNGCLRWKPSSDEYVTIREDGSVETAVSPKSRVKPGDVAGTVGFGKYNITYQRNLSCGLRMVWQHVTGELVMGKIRTMDPRCTNFRIDNLYLVPFDQSRVHRDRAKNRTVVSYCFERKQYTVVDVDHSYNKQMLSYHDAIDDAMKALNKPEVSFL